MAEEKPVTAPASISDCFIAAACASAPRPSGLCLRLKMIFCWLKGAAATLRSFIRNQASSAMITSSGTQRNAPFWSQMSLFPFASCCGPPAGAPSTAVVTTNGATSCTTLTPRLPRPPLRPLTLPFSRLGMAVSQNSWDFEKPKPTSFSLTTVTDQTCQTTKPSISAGMETQRLRWATARPVNCQKSSSSGRHSPMVAPGS